MSESEIGDGSNYDTGQELRDEDVTGENYERGEDRGSELADGSSYDTGEELDDEEVTGENYVEEAEDG